MSENPYESPKEAGYESAPPLAAKPAQSGRVVFPLIWAAFLFLGLPAVQQVPLFVQVLSTFVTGWTISRLPGAARGWGYVFVASLYVVLCFLQFLVWVFPWHP